MSVPPCVNWSVEEVADWVQSLGFPQYRVSHTSVRVVMLTPRSLLRECRNVSRRTW